MTKFLLAAGAVAAIAWAAPALTQAAAPAPAKAIKTMTRADVVQKVQRHFALLDSNRDGFVTQAEAQARGGRGFQRVRQHTSVRRDPAEMFTRFDTNRDGQITRAEADAVRGHGRKPTTLAGAVRAHAFGGRMFAMADADKDGRISLQEATAASLRHFDSADADRDGTVTREERRQMRQQRRGAAPQG